MRTFILSALAIVTLGLLAISPASAANGAWECMSPAFACGGASAAKSHRAYEHSGERNHRRHTSGKHKLAHVAKHETHKAESEAKPQAKVDLPAKKHQQAAAPTTDAKASERAYRVSSSQSGMASYYGFEAGSQTASGQRFNPSAMTAAHRTLPFGTKVRVTNKRNGKSVIVTINDRGPFIRGRIIDLSTAAAGVIGMRSSGVAPVTVERIANN